MKNRSFNEKQISLLGFGCMRFPETKGKIDSIKTEEILDYGYNHGVNYFDTAPIYHNGESETVLGRVMKKYDRKSFYIADKLSAWTVNSLDGVKRLFENQLKKLQTDYIDFYLCHAMNEEYYLDYKKNKYIEYLHSLKEQGLIKHLGFSYHGTVSFLNELVKVYPFEFGQLQINYLDWQLQDAKTQYEILKDANIPCVVMEPCRGGALASLCPEANDILKKSSDKSIASWAFRYVASLDNVFCVLSGMSDMNQVIDNIDTMTNFQKLTTKQQNILGEAVDVHKKRNSVPCTGCNYCNKCPSSIDIKQVFKHYNEYLLTKNMSDYLKENAKKCVNCGICMTHCPQNINISSHMSDIKNL